MASGLEHIEILGHKRVREGSDVLPDNETLTVYSVVFTPEVVATPEPAAAPAAPRRPDDESDDDTNEEVAQELTATEFYDRFVARTAEQARAELMAPQRSLQWLEARRHAITASNFGAAAGHNKYMTPQQLLKDKLWCTFKGNEFTAYGTYHEPDARATLERMLEGPLQGTVADLYHQALGRRALVTELSYELFETGLMKAAEQPWMAVSPDGLLAIKGPHGTAWALVEYKCPAALRDSDSHPYASQPLNVPEYYMDQVQGIMGLLNKWPALKLDGAASAGLDVSTWPAPHSGIKHALFVVWQPHQAHVTRVPFRAAYYADVLEPALSQWFFGSYLPLATLKHAGLLAEGSTQAGATVHL